MDIQIKNKTSNKAYVIENKIKSLPHIDQLNKYEEKLSSNMMKGVLTGFEETLNIVEKKKWEFISYKTIAIKIKEFLDENIVMDKFDRLYLEEYQKVLELLTKVFDKHLNDSKRLDYTCDDLEEIKLDDIYKKFVASKFVKYLEENNIAKNRFNITQSFHNKNATITIEKRMKKDDSKKIGIQLEGYQFRLFVYSDKNGEINDNNLKKLFNEYANIGWFDSSFDKKAKGTDKQIHGMKTRMSPKNNKHNKYHSRNNYIMPYQHFEITKKLKNYDELLKYIKYLLGIIELIENDKKVKIDFNKI